MDRSEGHAEGPVRRGPPLSREGEDASQQNPASRASDGPSEEVGPFDDLTLRIEDLAYGGAGISRIDGLVVFVRGVVPGDVVRARVRKRRTSFAEADLLEIIHASESRIAAPCKHFGPCGGCQWMNITYEAQLEYKQRQVVDCLERIGRLDGFTIRPIVPSPRNLNYRNRMEFTFDEGATGTIAGLHAASDPSRIEEIDECLLQSARANEVFRWVKRECRRLGLSASRAGDRQGFLVRVVIRAGRSGNGAEGGLDGGTSGILVVLVTRDRPFPAGEDLAKRLRTAFPDVTGVGRSILGENGFEKTIEALSGDLTVEEVIDGMILTASAGAFLQVNPPQAERLYREVLDLIGVQSHERVLDLYCGVGAMTLLLARRAQSAMGVEASPSAVLSAERNATLNRLGSCRFIQGDALRVAERLVRRGGRADVVVLNPPRAGIPEGLVGVTASLGPSRIVYVSCDPSTLARDLARFARQGYVTTDVAPFDMFPHTFHVETVARLERRISSSPVSPAPPLRGSRRSDPRTSGRSRRERG